MKIEKNILLKNHSHIKIGGYCPYFITLEKKDDLYQLSDFLLTHQNTPYLFLGGATNILFNDDFSNIIIIKNSLTGIKLLKENTDNILIECYSGNFFSSLVDFCIENSLLGLEWAGGLPGSVGGAILGNAGAFKGETKDNIIEVTTFDFINNTFKKYSKEECSFSYRNSIFKNKKAELIISAIFSLKKGEKEVILKSTEEKINYRKEKQPLNYPNLGSIFKNIPWDSLSDINKNNSLFISKKKDDPFPVLPVAVVLDSLNLKGFKVGDIEVSTLHPNFLINTNNGTEKDMKILINKIKEIVKEKYDITLQEEIITF